MRKTATIVMLLFLPLVLVNSVAAQAQSQVIRITLGPGAYSFNWYYENLDGFYLSGAGPDTVISPVDPDEPIIELISSQNIVIENLTLDGVYNAGSYHVTRFDDVQNLLIRNVVFDGADKRAINVMSNHGTPQNENIRIEDNRFVNMPRDAIYVGYAKTVQITGNTIHDSHDVAVDMGEEVENVVISDNTILDSQNGILMAHGFYNVVINGNVLQGISGCGIKMDGPHETYETGHHYVISDNTIEAVSDGLTAIRLIDAPQGIVAGNVISGFESIMIRVDSSDVAVTGNVFWHPETNWAIRVTEPRVNVSGNTFYLDGVGGVFTQADDVVIADNVFFNNATLYEVSIQSDGASRIRVSGNTFYDANNGIYLYDTTYSLVDDNVFMGGEVVSGDVREVNASDYNRIRYNLVREESGLVIVGEHSVSVGNEWWE